MMRAPTLIRSSGWSYGAILRTGSQLPELGPRSPEISGSLAPSVANYLPTSTLARPLAKAGRRLFRVRGVSAPASHSARSVWMGDRDGLHDALGTAAPVWWRMNR